MSGIKRKSPYGSMSASPAPHSRGASAPVKSEGGDLKRMRGLTGTPSSSSYNYNDPRTVVLELRDTLKDRMTMRWDDAFYLIEERNPSVDPNVVLDMLKTKERVKFNETNRVFTYEPEIVLKNQADLRTHIRTHSQPTKGIACKDLRVAMPGPELTPFLEELERDGSVLILRSFTGKLRDAPLPPLGGTNAWGEKLNAGGPERWKTVFWDELKERGRAGNRVDDEFITEWAGVNIAETDDVAKLLEGQDLKASTAVTQEKKKEDDSKNKGKKKKRRGRALKITNTHMKALGIDFSKDYQGE